MGMGVIGRWWRLEVMKLLTLCYIGSNSTAIGCWSPADAPATTLVVMGMPTQLTEVTKQVFFSNEEQTSS
jgi:hypothetical protein